MSLPPLLRPKRCPPRALALSDLDDFFAKKDKKKKKKGKKGFAAVDSSQAAAVLTLRGKPAVRNSTPCGLQACSHSGGPGRVQVWTRARDTYATCCAARVIN